MLDELIVVPARYKSSRLPGKPLIDLAGRPMILRTVDRCLEAVEDREKVVVATDDERIAEVCASEGIRYEMTSPDHPTGTDRVAEVAARIEAETYLNIQGDEPVFDPQDIRALIEASREDRAHPIVGYAPITDERQFTDTKFPKVLFNQHGELLYIGRAAVPGSHTGEFVFGYRQVCGHAFPGSALQTFASTGGRRTRLEAAEDHEMLRFLDLGVRVRVLQLTDHSVAVDRESDVPRAVAALEARGLT